MASNKVFQAEIKVLGDPEQGSVEFYASVFGNTDKFGDVMDPKAFDRTLAEDYRAKNKRMPVTFAHALAGGSVPGADPWAFIGHAEANDIVADEHGLRVKAQLDMSNPYAVQVQKLLRQGLIDQASFTFSVNDEKAQRDGSRLIKDVSLYEAGPCLVGVNGETEVLAVKTEAFEKIIEIEQKAAHTGAAAGMREHLVASKPEGHGMLEGDAAEIGAASLTRKHSDLHEASSVGHDKTKGWQIEEPEPEEDENVPDELRKDIELSAYRIRMMKIDAG